MSHHPPGFRFYPTEEELLGFFLPNKLNNMREDMERVIPVVDVYSFDPWQLPPIACVGDSEQWFFFCPRQAREAHGGRPARTTPAGYWKATGSPSLVYSSDKRVLGRKKTMVFYRGRAPVGTKTKWKMNEYRALAEDATNTPGATPELRNEFSLCRVYVNTGSMRSFDRRPVGTASENLRALDPASTSTANQSMVERASSQDGSASGDDDSQPSAAGGGGNDWEMMMMMMMQDIDWESLDRL